jgi:phage regulator Rha-like protein
MFQLNSAEKAEVVTICDHLAGLRFSKTLPYAFTEHGSIMAANVLNSDKAVEMSVFVVRAFVKLREVLLNHKELAEKLASLDKKVSEHDETIRAIINAVHELMGEKKKAKTKVIGFEREC